MVRPPQPPPPHHIADENDEEMALMKQRMNRKSSLEKTRKQPTVRLRWFGVCVALVVATIAASVYLSSRSPLLSTQQRKLPVQYECAAPTYFHSSPDKKSEEDRLEEYNLEEEAMKMTEEKLEEFLGEFRRQKYDGWGRTYNRVKRGMASSKRSWFRDLKSGMSIYESACGVGLNLYMTLELLAELDPTLHDIYLYGNEYLPESVDKARLLFEKAPPPAGKQGIVCPADSTNISFVPSDSFDLVYTGYITPIMDPLHLGFDDHTNWDLYSKWCDEASEDTQGKETLKSQILVRTAQDMQHDFYGKWVSEMIRVAKPGAPVIVEQVSYPYCEEQQDWGGVNHTFWKSMGREKYGWDIDPTSVEFAKDTLMKNRYHVYMRKRQD